jgi:hypothetical protein
MTHRFDEAGQPGAEGGGRHLGDSGDSGTPSGWLRGVVVVLIALVIGILLMPSATRPPLAVATTAPTTSSTSANAAGSAGSAASSTSVPRSTSTTSAGALAGASAIHVLVANGTTISHLAEGTASYLRSRGFVTLAPTNSTMKVTGTQVYAASGQQVAATLVVNALGLPSNTVQSSSAVAPVASTGGATVVVIVGPDLARLAPSSSSTTAGAAG